MDIARFDALARALAAPTSRRTAGRFLAGLGLAGVLLQADGDALGARKDKKRKPKRKPRFNAFGCVNLGGFCKRSGQCCSGICRGRRCQAHNDGFTACEAGPLGFCAVRDGGLIAGTPCTSSTDENGLCFTTTGNAPYCAVGAFEAVADIGCVACKKDRDCETFCGEDAACLKCPACQEQFGVATACAGPADTCQF
jgi:hypothetical protein